MESTHKISCTFLLVMLSACGGGGDNPNPQPSPSTNTAPVLIDPGALGVKEGQTSVVKLTATDADNDPIIFSISAGVDKHLFTLDSTTGDLAFIEAANFEQPSDSDKDNQYQLTVTASDGKSANSSDSVDLTVQILSNSAPVLNDHGALRVKEGQTSIVKLTATDADNDPVTFSISEGVDKDLFTLDSTTGDVAFIEAADYEQPKDSDKDNQYQLTVTASDGKALNSIDLTIQVIPNASRPTAVISIGNQSGSSPLIVNFNARDSIAGSDQNNIKSYLWDFGDGIQESYQKTQHILVAIHVF